MNRPHLASACLCTLLTGSAFAQATITGQITDAASKDALSGLAVTLENEWGQELNPPVRTVTDENGHYRMTHLESGSYRLKAEFQQKIGGRTLVFGLPTRTFDLGADPVEVDFSFVPLEDTSPAYRYVVEKADGIVDPGEVLRLGEQWPENSKAYDSSGEIVSIEGGYFSIRYPVQGP